MMQRAVCHGKFMGTGMKILVILLQMGMVITQLQNQS